MKLRRLWALALVLVAVPVAVRCQATYELINKRLNYGLDAPVYDWTGARLWGAQWRVEIYGGPTTDSLVPLVASGSESTRIIMQFVTPGYFRGVEGSVASLPAGGWAWLQVKVWDLRLGASYEETHGLGIGGYGQSDLFYARGGNMAALEVGQPLLGLQSFSVLQEVPEPSTHVLMFTGIGCLCWLCRHKV